MYRVWYSTEAHASFIIDHTRLRDEDVERSRLYESDANNARHFHAMPDHIKQILYLDAPDIIVERNARPIFSVEFSMEAGTGHNAFQRFARLAASVENGVPAFYVYPEAVIVHRRNAPSRWDRINPMIFRALEAIMSVHAIPALLYYFPSDFRDTPGKPGASSFKGSKGLLLSSATGKYPACPNATDGEMLAMFKAMDEVLDRIDQKGMVEGRVSLLGSQLIQARRRWMTEQANTLGTANGSPVSATLEVDTDVLLDHMASNETGGYRIGELLRSRKKSILYCVNAGFRGDPYPGALAALDYMLCREGKTYEERNKNLVLVWGACTIGPAGDLVIDPTSAASVNDFCKDVRASESKNLLGREYADLRSHEVPRYYMQARHGSTFSKVKHIRVYSYFADAILFKDGALWRDG